MSETPRTRDDHPTGERPVPDGGTDVVGGTAPYQNVADRTVGTRASDVPRLGDDEGQHLFAPAELPSWALSLPVVGALAVAIGAQGSVVLAGGASAWAGTVLAAVAMLVVVSLAVRSI